MKRTLPSTHSSKRLSAKSGEPLKNSPNLKSCIYVLIFCESPPREQCHDDGSRVIILTSCLYLCLYLYLCSYACIYVFVFFRALSESNYAIMAGLIILTSCICAWAHIYFLYLYFHLWFVSFERAIP